MPKKPALKEESPTSYDEVPYESLPYPFTHPRHLYTVAKLFGLTPPDFRTARVLELGCAGGGNLLPVAINYPKVQALGLDLSKEHVAHANKQKKALGLTNIDFRHQNILDFNTKEKFDYIICHGVLSWVPENVREKIFDICSKCLTPNGLAVITYNTLPGWNAVRSLREMMLYHIGRFPKPQEKIQQARAILDFLAENTLEDNRGTRALIEDERNILKKADDYYLYHDHLETTNAQFYLHDFVRTANTHGLSYVGDTNVSSMYINNLPPKIMETLKALEDVVTQEQYMDFVTNRRFRTSILCRQSMPVNRTVKGERILDFFLTFHPEVKVTGPDAQGRADFQVNNAKFTTHNENGSVLYMELAANGQSPLAAKELIDRAKKKLKLKDDAALRTILIDSAMSLVLRGFINISPDAPPHVTEVSKKPKAAPLARYQASQPGCKLVTSTFGGTVRPHIVEIFMLQNLDGTKTADQIADILVKEVLSGTLKMDKDGMPMTNEEDIRLNIRNVVDELLPRLAKTGLLVG